MGRGRFLIGGIKVNKDSSMVSINKKCSRKWTASKEFPHSQEERILKDGKTLTSKYSVESKEIVGKIDNQQEWG